MNHPRRGFSLLELVIVMAIFSILTVMGFGLVRDTIPRWKARKAAVMFKGHVHTCRMIAVETGKECRIYLEEADSSPASTTADNKGHYYVQIGDSSLNSEDFDTLPTSLISLEGDIDLSEGSTHYVKHVSIMEWDTISGTTASGADTIVFSPRGFVTNPNGDFNDGYITVKFVNKVAYSKGINDIFEVKIARTGMTRLDNDLMGDPYASAAPGTTSSSTND